MKNSGPYIVYAALALIVLCVVSAVSYLQGHITERTAARTSIAKPLSEQQIQSRRQAPMGTVAIAATTTQ